MNTPPEVSAAYVAATEKQRALALALAQGMGKEEAMLHAGYSKVQAHKTPKEVIEHPRVVILAGWYAGQAIQKNELTAARAVEEMANIALFDPADIHDDDGEMLPVNKWPASARAAFAGWDSMGRPKFWNKADAVERITKIKGWQAPDKLEVKAVVGVVVVPSKGGAVIDAQSTTTISIPPKG